MEKGSYLDSASQVVGSCNEMLWKTVRGWQPCPPFWVLAPLVGSAQPEVLFMEKEELGANVPMGGPWLSEYHHGAPEAPSALHLTAKP